MPSESRMLQVVYFLLFHPSNLNLMSINDKNAFNNALRYFQNKPLKCVT